MSIHLNSAEPEEIARAVPQVSEKRAQEIAERRPFQSWEEVRKIPGFDEEMIESLREGGVTLE